MPSFILKFSLALTVILLTMNVQAAQLHALHEVEHAAYLYALNEARENYDNPQISLEPLDNRLRLHACDTPLQTFSNSDRAGSGMLTVGVKCQGPVSWTIYLPAKIKVMKAVVVTVNALPANHILSDRDLRIETRDTAGLRQGYLSTSKDLIGQQLRHPLGRGAFIQSKHLRAQTLVHRGEQITLIAGVAGMEVRVRGEAMADASLGDKVKVKNSSSERIVEGVVDAAGVVRVRM